MASDERSQKYVAERMGVGKTEASAASSATSPARSSSNRRRLTIGASALPGWTTAVE
jgi:hypothetical protein